MRKTLWLCDECGEEIGVGLKTPLFTHHFTYKDNEIYNVSISVATDAKTGIGEYSGPKHLDLCLDCGLRLIWGVQR